MPEKIPLSAGRIDELSHELREQAQAYTKARADRGVDNDSFDVAAARAALEKTENVEAVELNWDCSELAGVSIHRTQGRTTGVLLLYIHGGGFVGGNWASHAHICDHLARVVGCETIFADYRLAPEHPFPAAFEDVEAVFRGLPQRRSLILAGDSVGGAMAMFLAMLDRDEGGRRVEAAALLAPMLDFDERTSHYMKNYGRARRMIANALSQCQLSDPRLQIFDSRLDDLPPIIIQTGGADYVQDDGHRLASALREADNPVVLEHWPHMPHVWHRYTPAAPEAFNAIERAGRFLRAHARS